MNETVIEEKFVIQKKDGNSGLWSDMEYEDSYLNQRKAQDRAWFLYKFSGHYYVDVRIVKRQIIQRDEQV